MRLQLFALAYNVGNFLRMLALPSRISQWTLTTLREKMIKIGAKVIRHTKYVTFQMAEMSISWPVETKRIGPGLEFLKMLPNNRRIQSGEEESDGLDRSYGKSRLKHGGLNNGS